MANEFAAKMMDIYQTVALLGLFGSFEDLGTICERDEEAMPTFDGLGFDLCVRDSGTPRHARR